jgi:hypothetical protein
MKGCWILSKAFSSSIERILWFLSLLYDIYRFAYVEPSLHPWNETDLVMMYDYFCIFFHLSICAYIVWAISLSSLSSCPLFLHPPGFHAEPFLPSSPILLKRRHKQ